MSRPIALPLCPTRRAEVEHGLALMQVRDRCRDTTAERRLDRRLRGGVALTVVENGAEDLVALLVPRRDVGAAAVDRVRRPATTGRRALGNRGSGGGVALAHLLADVCIGQLSHADSSSRASGVT